MLTLEPTLSILDETDSGLDIDALKIVAKGVNNFRSKERSFLAITHYQRLLDYMKPDFIHVLIDGEIVKSGNSELAKELEEKGYSWLENDTLPEQLTSLLENSMEENEDIRSLRLNAFDSFKKLGFPTKKDEDWRFTNFSNIQNGYFRLSRPSDLPNNFKSPKLLNDQSYPIVIINGHYQPQLSIIPNGLSIFSGSDDFKSNPHSYAIDSNKPYSSKMKNPFYLLNTSLMNSGLSFEISENIQIEKPIEIFFCTSEIDEPIMNHPRFHFRLRKNSKATIIEHYRGQTKQSYFINTVSNFELEENAHLSHFRFQDENFHSNHTSFSGYTLNKYSNLNCNCLSIGSDLYRHNISRFYRLKRVC